MFSYGKQCCPPLCYLCTVIPGNNKKLISSRCSRNLGKVIMLPVTSYLLWAEGVNVCVSVQTTVIV